MSSPHYDDSKSEAEWLSEQSSNVHRYLERERIPNCEVAANPEWFLAPYVSVWKVSSKAASRVGAVTWWAISGDLPTDYMRGDDATDVRTALAAFAERWREVSAYMLRGEEHPTVRIGRPEDRRNLGDLLNRRALILEDWIKKDELWP